MAPGAEPGVQMKAQEQRRASWAEQRNGEARWARRGVTDGAAVSEGAAG